MFLATSSSTREYPFLPPTGPDSLSFPIHQIPPVSTLTRQGAHCRPGRCCDLPVRGSRCDSVVLS